MMKSFFFCVLLFCSAALAADRPNVVLIITDDQGYGDIAAHGNSVIQTPNMDALHAESVRLTNFHVDPTCAPTRGALMTGKYSHRAKVWHTIMGGNSLRASEVTMADVFKASGYATGLFGKWHLGANYPYRPMDRGFEEWLGQGDGGTGTTDDYFTNDRVNDHYLHNGVFEFRPGYAPDVIYGAAIDYIKNRDKTKPFFTYISTYVPHSPHTIPDRDWTAKYDSQVDSFVAYFFASIERVDRNIGLLRQTLAEQGLAENTVVIFMTDNGGTAGVKFFNAGMRGNKGQVYEGGHRVPFFVHWPGGGLRHGSDVADLNAHIDVLPTLVELCGLTPERSIDFDGRSFREQLFDPGKLLEPRTLFVETQRTYEPQKWTKAVAMTNRWRLVDDKELYDLVSDPAQAQNVIGDYPEVVKKLRVDFDGYWRRVSPGDRDRANPIVGHAADAEVFLSSSDWYLPTVPWNHQATSRGSKYSGAWLITVAEPATYVFEVRRWPAEADAPIAGIPVLSKKVDAYEVKGSKPYLIYGGDESPFKALAVRAIRLTVGDWVGEKMVGSADTHITFEVPLGQADYEVKAEMLDAKQEVIAGAYYVYCRKK